MYGRSAWVGNYIPPEQGLKPGPARGAHPAGGVGNYIPPEQGLKRAPGLRPARPDPV